MVTAPVQKSTIHGGGGSHSRATPEYLAARTRAALPVMMLQSPSLRVALVTTHLPLSEVPRAITPDRLRATLRIVHADLGRHFSVNSPRIAVAFHFIQLLFSASAWWVIAGPTQPRPRLGAYIVLRWIREGVNNLLPEIIPTRKRHLQDVDYEERDVRHHEPEVEEARKLVSAQQPREYVELGGLIDCQPGEQRSRAGQDDESVGNLLRAVIFAHGRMLLAQVQIVQQHLPGFQQGVAIGNEFAPLAGEERYRERRECR